MSCEIRLQRLVINFENTWDTVISVLLQILKCTSFEAKCEYIHVRGRFLSPLIHNQMSRNFREIPTCLLNTTVIIAKTKD